MPRVRTSGRPLLDVLVAVLVVIAGPAAVAGCSTAADHAAPGAASTVAPPSTRVTASTATTQRSTENRTTAGTTGERVVVVGDSITNEGRVEIAAALGGGHRVVIDGRPGLQIAQQQPTAEALAATRPAIAIIELGTNDVVSSRDVSSSVDDMARMVETFAASRCIVLVTVDTGLARAGAPARARILDDSYRALAQGDPRIRLVDVDAIRVASESDPRFVGPFLYDGIHPTAAGHARLAAAYADAISGCGA